jgi:hypothetical protein
VATSVSYTAVLTVREETVLFVSGLMHAERCRRATRARAPGWGFAQAVMVIRWLLDGIRVAQLADGNQVGKSTAYEYLHEGIEALAAARAPDLRGALLAAKLAGHPHVIIDGTLIETDRVATPGPTPGVDLWWSGRHANHGGNVQVITAPDGWPLWTSEVLR